MNRDQKKTDSRMDKIRDEGEACSRLSDERCQ